MLKTEITEFDKSIKETKKTGTNEKFEEFQEKNPWYGKDKEMTIYADAQANLPEYEGMMFEKMTKLITAKVKQMFPEKFDKDTEKVILRSSPVEKSTRTKKTPNKKFTRTDLTESQKVICDRFVRQGIITQEEYISELAAIGELE